MRRLLLLCALAACAGIPNIGGGAAPMPAYDPYPPIPDTIWVAAGPVPVYVDSLAISNGIPLGQFQTFLRKVVINRDITSTALRWKTLEHERCHIILRDSGVELMIGRMLEATQGDPIIIETMCDAFASARLNQMAHK